MTDPALVTSDSRKYAADFLNALEHPIDIWDTAFREHIPRKAQHLLINLFFSSEYGVDIEELRESFGTLHNSLCSNYNVESAPTDFEDGLKLLEGSFISIRDRQVSFVNPSVRD